MKILCSLKNWNCLFLYREQACPRLKDSTHNQPGSSSLMPALTDSFRCIVPAIQHDTARYSTIPLDMFLYADTYDL